MMVNELKVMAAQPQFKGPLTEIGWDELVPFSANSNPT